MNLWYRISIIKLIIKYIFVVILVGGINVNIIRYTLKSLFGSHAWFKGVFGTAPQTPPWSSSTKNWNLWSISLGALTTPPFFLEQSAWSWNRLAKKCGAELKNVERSSPNTPFIFWIYWLWKYIPCLINNTHYAS